MNFLQWLIHYKLDNNNQLDLQFGMSMMCIWLIFISFWYSIFYIFIGVSELLYVMLLLFFGSWVMLFYCRRARQPKYVIPYLFFVFISVLTHFFITYYLGDCRTEFFVVAVLLAPHMYQIVKKRYIIFLDILLLAAISFVFWFSSNLEPIYPGLIGNTHRIILMTIGLLTCLIELYLNMSAQNFIAIARERLIERASAEAVIDELTGLGNRRMLERHRAELDEACAEKIPICVAILDIDFFKNINDTHGHIAGDQVLEFTASTMKDFFRKSDLLIRWGGEEFLVILRDTELDDATVLMERFRLKIQTTPLLINGLEIRVRLTIGLTELDSSLSLDDSIKEADELMYQGKLQGRNLVIWRRGH